MVSYDVLFCIQILVYDEIQANTCLKQWEKRAKKKNNKRKTSLELMKRNAIFSEYEWSYWNLLGLMNVLNLNFNLPTIYLRIANSSFSAIMYLVAKWYKFSIFNSLRKHEWMVSESNDSLRHAIITIKRIDDDYNGICDIDECWNQDRF